MDIKDRGIFIGLYYLALLFLVIGCSEDREISLSPEQALKKFYANQGAEDQLMDPLIVAGKGVVPFILVEIENKNMINRRYAIGALGNIKDKSALPILEKIVGDDTEKDYLRCDALNSIGMIDFNKSKELAAINKSSHTDCLSALSLEILTNEYDTWMSSNYMYRSLEDARSGKHY